MPWKHEWVEPELAFKCSTYSKTNGRKTINVYHTYKDHEHDERLTYWYTLGDGLDSWDDPTTIHNFDIRDFPTYDETLSHRHIMQLAIDRQLCTIEDVLIYIQPINRGSNAEQ